MSQESEMSKHAFKTEVCDLNSNAQYRAFHYISSQKPALYCYYLVAFKMSYASNGLAFALSSVSCVPEMCHSRWGYNYFCIYFHCSELDTSEYIKSRNRRSSSAKHQSCLHCIKSQELTKIPSYLRKISAISESFHCNNFDIDKGSASDICMTVLLRSCKK